MERRRFIASGLSAAVATPLISSVIPNQSLARPIGSAEYEKDEILNAGSNFLGVTVEALGGAIEKIFSDYGDKPTAYIAGQELSGAIGLGLRYGKGLIHIKSQSDPKKVFWQGPSAGFDTGGNASRLIL
jgi:hypothetical protein